MNGSRLLFSIQFLLLITCALSAQSTRERLSFNEGWLFRLDDPPGAADTLDYQKVKTSLLATGRYDIKGDRAAPPDVNLGRDVAYTQNAFNDSGWRKLNLPHDWAIEGDFQQTLPGDIGKRPFAGVGWYRKHFNIGAQDKGKQ